MLRTISYRAIGCVSSTAQLSFVLAYRAIPDEHLSEKTADWLSDLCRWQANVQRLCIYWIWVGLLCLLTLTRSLLSKKYPGRKQPTKWVWSNGNGDQLSLTSYTIGYWAHWTPSGRFRMKRKKSAILSVMCRRPCRQTDCLKQLNERSLLIFGNFNPHGCPKMTFRSRLLRGRTRSTSNAQNYII